MVKKKTHVSKIQNHGGGPPWSDFNRDVLNLVMMELGVVDFVSFSGVCKSWRSLALANKIRFMACKPPMELYFITEWSNKTDVYSLVDFKGRRFKILLPESGGRRCVGLTCGYLVFLVTKSCDILLMNPITRHVIGFPPVPCNNFYPSSPTRIGVTVILVFSQSTFTWVLVVLRRHTTKIWFSIAGKGEWGSISSYYRIIDVHECKGKIYALDTELRLYELGLDLEPKLTLLKTKNTFGRNLMFPEFVSSGENLYAMERFSWYERDYKIHKLDFGEMKWVSPDENSTEDYVFFVCERKHNAAIKPGLWSESGSWLRYKNRRSSGNIMFLNTGMWYFPHDCLKVNFIHE
ncbi:hypothetical protein LXL04_010473 [Taraxacum kok-saghyz]